MVQEAYISNNQRMINKLHRVEWIKTILKTNTVMRYFSTWPKTKVFISINRRDETQNANRVSDSNDLS